MRPEQPLHRLNPGADLMAADQSLQRLTQARGLVTNQQVPNTAIDLAYTLATECSELVFGHHRVIATASNWRTFSRPPNASSHLSASRTSTVANLSTGATVTGALATNDGIANRISSAMLSAIGPTTTCKLPPLPGRTTAIAPRAFNCASTALLRSTMSNRNRVVQAPTLSRLSAPPNAWM